MNHDLQDIKGSLLHRGVELGAPTALGKIETTPSILDVPVGRGFTSVYMEFDGFLTYDPLSYLRLWSLDEIKQNQPSLGDISGRSESNWLVIGDFLMDSDYIVSDVRKDLSPLRLLHDNRIDAIGIVSFLKALTEGHFDFSK